MKIGVPGGQSGRGAGREKEWGSGGNELSILFQQKHLPLNISTFVSQYCHRENESSIKKKSVNSNVVSMGWVPVKRLDMCDYDHEQVTCKHKKIIYYRVPGIGKEDG